MKKTVYAGTYNSQEAKGIYCFTFEDGRLSDPELFCEIDNSKYIGNFGNQIVSLCDLKEGSGVALIDDKGKIRDSLAFETPTSCYVCEHEEKIYTANYHAGTLSSIAVEEGRLKLLKSVLIREKAGCHQVLFHEGKILLPCLFLDRVLIFDEDLNKVSEIVLPNGSGPRHGVFSRDHSKLYLVSELSNELFVIETKSWTITDQILLLENGVKDVKGTAALRLSEDEKFLYVSTRGVNVLSVLSLQGEHPVLIQNVFCEGDHPRDFILLDSSLLCANRFSDEVLSFAIGEDGRILSVKDRVHVPQAVSLLADDDLRVSV